MQILLILALLISIVAMIFALQNTADVTVQFFAWSQTAPQAIVLLITLAIGVLIGVLISLPNMIKGSWVSSRQKKKMVALESSLMEYQQKLEDAKTKLTELQNPAPSATAAPPAAPVAAVPANGSNSSLQS